MSEPLKELNKTLFTFYYCSHYYQRMNDYFVQEKNLFPILQQPKLHYYSQNFAIMIPSLPKLVFKWPQSQSSNSAYRLPSLSWILWSHHSKLWHSQWLTSSWHQISSPVLITWIPFLCFTSFTSIASHFPFPTCFHNISKPKLFSFDKHPRLLGPFVWSLLLVLLINEVIDWILIS